MTNSIPNDSDWGDLINRDYQYAYEKFSGKSSTQAEELFKANVTMRSSDLEFMNRKPFIFYFKTLLRFYEKGNFDFMMSSGADTASCIISVINSKLNSSPTDIHEIAEEIIPILKSISVAQDSLAANRKIYGDFNDQIYPILSQLQT